MKKGAKKLIIILSIIFIIALCSLVLYFILHKTQYPMLEINTNHSGAPASAKDADFSFIYASTSPGVTFPTESLIEDIGIVSTYDSDFRTGDDGKNYYTFYMSISIPREHRYGFQSYLKNNCIKYSDNTEKNGEFGNGIMYKNGYYKRYAFQNPKFDLDNTYIDYCQLDSENDYAYVEIKFINPNGIRPKELNSYSINELTQITPPDLGTVFFSKTTYKRNSAMPYSYFIEMFVNADEALQYVDYIKNKNIASDITGTEKFKNIVNENESLKSCLDFNGGAIYAYEHTYHLNEGDITTQITSYVFITEIHDETTIVVLIN